MGGKSENTSECKSVTNSSRNLPSQDDKGSEAKGRKHNGRSASGDKKNENTQPSKLTYTSEEDIYYEPGDCVYIDSQRPDVAYFICAIKEFRMSKRDSLVVVVRWYYRPSEVPESVYQLLIQDRNAENGSGDNILEDVAVKERELFISDATDVYPASALRGKCKVRPFVEITDSVKGYIDKEDCFFYVLGYNPETRRLANTKGEIRVGVSHQATLPECCPFPVNGFEDRENPMEELVWNPTLDDYELMMFLRAARSMAQYAGMCNGGSPEDGYSAVSQDATTSNALNVLHQNNYDAAKALQALVKKPYPKELEKRWSEDETKKFVKGLRQYGKNFYKIKKELLSHKETGELVEYYYTWKKTPTALSSRPHRRRRHNVLRRKALPRSSKSIVSEFVDLSSCSEEDYDSDDSERDLSLYCCRHCYTTESRSWHHGSQNKVILCDDCRIYYKKYGKLPATDETREPPPYMFKGVVEREIRDEDGYLVNGKLALRSRRAIPPVQTTLRSGRNKTSSPVEGANSESSVGSRRLAKINKVPSPSSGSTSSTGSNGGKDKVKKGKLKKGKKRRRDQSPENQTNDKRKKAQTQDSDEDANDNASDTSSTTGGRDSVLPDHDASSVCSNSSNNNDEVASNRSCSPADASEPIKLPDRFKRLISGEEGRSCARTDVVFVHSEKPKKDTTCSREVSVTKESSSKAEASESSTEVSVRSNASQSPYNAPATVTSHYEASLRNYMAGGQYHLYPPNIPPGMSSQGINISGFPPPSVGVDYRMLPFHMFSGMGVVPAGDSRENAAKFAEGFEQWYAPYRSAQLQSGHHLSAISYLQGQGRALEQSALDSRSHESLLKGGPGRVLTTDPATGLQYYGPQQHSHSHLHTHFHIHPHEQQQHLQNLQAASLSALDQAYLQHPGLTSWRNNPALWQHPELMHLHGNNARGIFPEELAALPVHALASTPFDRQLQQQLIMSPQSKYHPQHMLAHEEFMRYCRQQNRAQQRLESEKMNDHFLSNIFKKEHRNLQSPSQLENVVKKSLDSSGMYSSPSKKQPVTIDLSDD
ncbi:arginine-glutamic acid dipeptide repeats protein isoform X1 [Pocillopora verrucosa]|uniref:arginine-glutamic acid dipeptide repeats protein isoform X1 n=2 Tax=Pocillopora verrucosa TaxID=203993 RepID=UPI0033400703